jgi:hypothetical protein
MLERTPRYSMMRVPLRIGSLAKTPLPWMPDERVTYLRVDLFILWLCNYDEAATGKLDRAPFGFGKGAL